MGTWTWSPVARAVGELKSQGLDNKDILDLYKEGGSDALLELAS